MVIPRLRTGGKFLVADKKIAGKRKQILHLHLKTKQRVGKKLFWLTNWAVARALIGGGGIFIYSCYV